MIDRRNVLVVTMLGLAACGSKHAPAEAHAEKEPESHPAQAGTVRLTPEQLATTKLATGRVEKRALSGMLEATAQIEPAADRHARVGARIAGRIVAVKAGVGDEVKQGQVLAVVDSPEVGRAKADYLAAVAAAHVTAETATREKALFEKRISSERDYREAEAASVRARSDKEAAENRLHALGVSDADLPRQVAGHYVSTVAVAAPIDGVVVDRPVTLGQMIEPADSLFVVMDLRQVWILMDVYERDLAQVKEGQTVNVSVAAYPGRAFPGTVQSIGAVVEPKSRAVKVRVVLDNADRKLKPGMFASVELEGTTGETRTPLVVPSAALQRDGADTIVFVPRGEREYARRVVKIGHDSGGFAEVLQGLAEGETVVTAGSFLVKSELKKGELGGEE